MQRISAARLGMVLTTTAAVLLTLPAAQAAAAAAPVYSDPDWWPLHGTMTVDCTHGDNCPSGSHQQWGIDLTTPDNTNSYQTDTGVYAMGAGIVHIGDAHGKACGFGGAHSDFGTWVWIDHGGGVVSKYGHLADITVSDGQQVYVGTKLGDMGSTGDASPKFCATEHYVDFQVRHDGVTGPTVEFSTTDGPNRDGDLLVCTASGPARVAEQGQAIPVWAGPGYGTVQANVYNRIDDLPHSWLVAGGVPGCGATTAQPSSPKVTTKAKGSAITTSWAKAPAAVNDIRVELDRRSGTHWQAPAQETWRDVGARSTSTRIGSLKSGKYRFRVWFHTAQGWTSLSGWVAVKAK